MCGGGGGSGIWIVVVIRPTPMPGRWAPQHSVTSAKRPGPHSMPARLQRRPPTHTVPGCVIARLTAFAIHCHYADTVVYSCTLTS